MAMGGLWVPGTSSALHIPPPLHESKVTRPIFQLRLREGGPLSEVTWPGRDELGLDPGLSHSNVFLRGRHGIRGGRTERGEGEGA